MRVRMRQPVFEGVIVQRADERTTRRGERRGRPCPSISQENNVKLQLIAEQIVADFGAAGAENISSRSVFDQLLLTAYRRVARPASQESATL
jgi:hypothetical protein